MLHVNWSAQFSIVNNSRITREIQFLHENDDSVGFTLHRVLCRLRCSYVILCGHWPTHDKVRVQKSETNPFYRRKIQA